MRALLVVNDKGGTRKSAAATLIADAALTNGLPVQIFQVDRQGRLPVLFPNLVTTIDMPATEELRQDDLADAEALAPLDDVLRDPDSQIVICEVGANMAARVADGIAAADTGVYLSETGAEVTICVPVTTDPESIVLGCRSLAVMREAFPGARSLVFLCQDGGSFEAISNADARREYETHLLPMIGAGDAARLPRLLPRALAALDASAMTPLRFANLGDADAPKVTGLPGSLARRVRGDVAKYVYEAMLELQRVLPFRRDS